MKDAHKARVRVLYWKAMSMWTSLSAKDCVQMCASSRGDDVLNVGAGSRTMELACTCSASRSARPPEVCPGLRVTLVSQARCRSQLATPRNDELPRVYSYYSCLGGLGVPT